MSPYGLNDEFESESGCEPGSVTQNQTTKTSAEVAENQTRNAVTGKLSGAVVNADRNGFPGVIGYVLSSERTTVTGNMT